MSSEVEHTPGPWFTQYGNNVFAGDKNNPRLVAACGETTKTDDGWEESFANAHLIATAPEMLQVLERLEESAIYWGEYDVLIGIVDDIQAVLKKARGFSSVEAS